ncbi:TPA: hypothetical protein DEG21_00650 [Patescibacteria group bacterium]|nr:hypothetical protein [Candidatus Gracilibacteria bacterium]
MYCLFTHSRRDARFTLSQMAVYSIFLPRLQIFPTIASHLFNHILTSTLKLYSCSNLSFNLSIVFCCSIAERQALYACFFPSQNVHQSAIIASHSYLFINHLLSIITSDVSFK